MKVAFGYTIAERNDFFVEGAKESSQISAKAMAPGKWLVNYYPIRKLFVTTHLNATSHSIRRLVHSHHSWRCLCLPFPLSPSLRSVHIV